MKNKFITIVSTRFLIDVDDRLILVGYLVDLVIWLFEQFSNYYHILSYLYSDMKPDYFCLIIPKYVSHKKAN